MTHGFAGATRTSVGLYDMRARHYSPTLGAFLTQDPLGPVDGPDRWLYAVGDPVNFSDRLGLAAHNPMPSPDGMWLLGQVPDSDDFEIPSGGDFVSDLLHGRLPRHLVPEPFRSDSVEHQRRRSHERIGPSLLEQGVDMVDEPSEIIHTTLDCFGMSECPLVSQGADGLDAAIYVMEGRDADAAISAAAVVGPGVVGAVFRLFRRSGRLKRALEAANNALRGVDGSLWQAHHLVPLELANRDVWIEFFDRARRAGWDIDAADNGIALATSDEALGEVGDAVSSSLLHSGRHDNYTNWVEDQLFAEISARGIGDADSIDGDTARSILESVQTQVRDVFTMRDPSATFTWAESGYVRK